MVCDETHLVVVREDGIELLTGQLHALLGNKRDVSNRSL